MPDGGDGALDYKNIGARFLRDCAEFRSPLRNRTYRGNRATVLDLAYSGPNQFWLHRFLVNFLQQGGNVVLVCLHNFLKHFGRILVARLDAFQIEHCQAAEPAHFDGKTHIHHAIHGAGQNRNLQLQRGRVASRQAESSINLVRINRDTAGDERDLVEPVSHARFSVTANPHSHRTLNAFEFESFVQTPTARTAREESIGAVFELEAANDAPQAVAKSSAFAPSAFPFTT